MKSHPVSPRWLSIARRASYKYHIDVLGPFRWECTMPSCKPANVRSGHIMREYIDLKATPIRFAYVTRFFLVPFTRTSMQPVIPKLGEWCGFRMVLGSSAIQVTADRFSSSSVNKNCRETARHGCGDIFAESNLMFLRMRERNSAFEYFILGK